VQVELEPEEFGVEGDRRVDVGHNIAHACVIDDAPPVNANRPALPRSGSAAYDRQ
jgi:hypothetical protein